MHTGKLIFNQLLRPLHPHVFHRIVSRYDGDYRIRAFSCWDQCICLAFGQLTFRESLRDLELFFKWIKGHLHLRRFWGNSINAVKTQIRVAVSVYVLMAIAKKQTKTTLSLHSIHQILSGNVFEKEPLHQLLTKDYDALFPNPPFQPVVTPWLLTGQ